MTDVSTVMAREHAVLCPECGGAMTLRASKHGNGIFYGCRNYPRCRGTHSAHPDGRPMGIPANQGTKAMRHEAHQAFDKLWKGKRPRYSRTQAYYMLQVALNIPKEEAHIGRFDINQCKRVIEWIAELEKARLI
jgi:ssDNA-binding Zn-finger/Zn-ribbon topoisomerase 1